MGVAILVQGVSFAEHNIGTVTPAEMIESLSAKYGIMAYNDQNQIKLLAVPTPENVFRDFLWAVDEGSQYASIDQNGMLTILPGANKATVKVSCTANMNPSVKAEATFKVNYASSLQSTGVIGCKIVDGYLATTTNTGICDTTFREIDTLPQYQVVKIKSTFDFTIGGNLYYTIYDENLVPLKTRTLSVNNLKTGLNLADTDMAGAKYIAYCIDIWSVSGTSKSNVDALKEVFDNIEFTYIVNDSIDTNNLITLT